MSRCDSAAIVPNTSELLPEPETPVNTVSRRLGISTLTSLRLFTRAPWTRIRSWLSASRAAFAPIERRSSQTVPDDLDPTGDEPLGAAARWSSPADLGYGTTHGGHHEPAPGHVPRPRGSPGGDHRARALGHRCRAHPAPRCAGGRTPQDGRRA